MDKKVFKIALTGGPCSGKTTSLSTVVQKFSNDFKVFTVPEMGTIAFHSGVVLDPKAYSEDDHKLFTQKICQVQIDLERFYDDLAIMQTKPTLIICDAASLIILLTRPKRTNTESSKIQTGPITIFAMIGMTW